MHYYTYIYYNAIANQNTEEGNKEQETTSNNVVSYRNESESMVTGGKVSSLYSDE